MLAARILAIGAACGAALYLFHLFCLWAEAKGWIFYRKTKASGNALGASALQLQGLFESGKTKYIIEANELKTTGSQCAGPDKNHTEEHGPR
jgi:hypothetical protein